MGHDRPGKMLWTPKKKICSEKSDRFTPYIFLSSIASTAGINDEAARSLINTEVFHLLQHPISWLRNFHSAV